MWLLLDEKEIESVIKTNEKTDIKKMFQLITGKFNEVFWD